MGADPPFRQRAEDGEIGAAQLASHQRLALLAEEGIGAQEEPRAQLRRPIPPVRNGVQPVRLGEVAPVFGDAAEQGPEGQATRRIARAMLAADLKDRPQVPRAE